MITASHVLVFKSFLDARLQGIGESGPMITSNKWPSFAKKIIASYSLLSALEVDELSILLLALCPFFNPDLLQSSVLNAFPNGGDLPMLGGVKGSNHRGMLPTGETAIAMLAGNNLEERMRIQLLLLPYAALAREGLLHLESVKDGEPPMSGRLQIPQPVADQLLFGREAAPRFGPEFPAKRVLTTMTWEDAVLPMSTRRQIDDIGSWLAHQQQVMQDANLSRKVKPGYRVLFYGPSGTGKTLTAALLGGQHDKEVYRIDLSQIVSKYIGETEKNLENVFKRAERRNWILFFDEADALFGKRTSVQSAHDKYANQEVSYLLQRVEDYNGLLILASNFKNNLDDAFVRRFHAIVHFPPPNAQERLMLWEKSLPAGLPLNGDVDLIALADKYDLTGAGILNAMHYAVLTAYGDAEKVLTQDRLIGGVRKEFLKEEKAVD